MWVVISCSMKQTRTAREQWRNAQHSLLSLDKVNVDAVDSIVRYTARQSHVYVKTETELFVFLGVFNCLSLISFADPVWKPIRVSVRSCPQQPPLSWWMSVLKMKVFLHQSMVRDQFMFRVSEVHASLLLILLAQRRHL